MLNAAVLTEPVSCPADLAARAGAAATYFAGEGRPWFLAAGQAWLGESADEALSRLGLDKTGSLTGMVTEQIAPPVRPLPDVQTRRIEDRAGRLALSDLNADAYGVPRDWLRDLGLSDTLWQAPLYGYNAYVDGQAVATSLVIVLGGVLYVGWVVTATAYRRRGLAELVMRRGLEHATRDTGITRTALHSTADGYPAYLKMGYRPVGEFALYGPTPGALPALGGG
jgi:GNAT superfamily N-acetyltransferase